MPCPPRSTTVESDLRMAFSLEIFCAGRVKVAAFLEAVAWRDIREMTPEKFGADNFSWPEIRLMLQVSDTPFSG